MNPPYEITPSILRIVTGLAEKIGEINANFMSKPSPTLRKQNRIKTDKSPPKEKKVKNHSKVKEIKTV